MGIRRFSYVGICVSDLERSLAFYRDRLGFRELSALVTSGGPTDTLLELEATKVRAIFLERDGARIELLHFESPGVLGDGRPRPMNATGMTHLSLRVDDLHETVADLRAHGVRVLENTLTQNPDFEAAAIFVTDPDGTRIELVQMPGDPSLLPGAG